MISWLQNTEKTLSSSLRKQKDDRAFLLEWKYSLCNKASHLVEFGLSWETLPEHNSANDIAHTSHKWERRLDRAVSSSAAIPVALSLNVRNEINKYGSDCVFNGEFAEPKIAQRVQREPPLLLQLWAVDERNACLRTINQINTLLNQIRLTKDSITLVYSRIYICKF